MHQISSLPRGWYWDKKARLFASCRKQGFLASLPFEVEYRSAWNSRLSDGLIALGVLGVIVLFFALFLRWIEWSGYGYMEIRVTHMLAAFVIFCAFLGITYAIFRRKLQRRPKTDQTFVDDPINRYVWNVIQSTHKYNRLVDDWNRYLEARSASAIPRLHYEDEMASLLTRVFLFLSDHLERASFVNEQRSLRMDVRPIELSTTLEELRNVEQSLVVVRDMKTYRIAIADEAGPDLERLTALIESKEIKILRST